MRRRKFELEDWTDEIERWEKIINNPWFLHKKMLKQIKKMDKKPLTHPPPCPHPQTGWWEHENNCFECGEVLWIQRVMKNDVGYRFTSKGVGLSKGKGKHYAVSNLKKDLKLNFKLRNKPQMVVSQILLLGL